MRKIYFYISFFYLSLLLYSPKPVLAVEKPEIKSNNLVFANDIVLEYGEEVDFNDYHIGSNATVVQTNYDPILLGQQDVSIYMKTDKLNYKIKRSVLIQDTQMPTLELKNDKVYIKKGNKYDLKNNIKLCSDPIDGEIIPEITGTVDFNKAGEYEIQVKAVDVNKNSTIKTFKVIVKNEEVVPQHVIENNSSKNKQHYINVLRIYNSYTHKYTQQIHDAIFGKNYDAKFYYEVDDDEFQYSLWEFEMAVFGSQSNHIYHSRNAAEQYYYLYIKEKETFEKKLNEAKGKMNSYENFIVKALNSMNLNCTDAEMAQQINNYIVKNFSYKITDIYNIRSFIELGYGQCWHYAQLFKDMCKSAGLNVRYIEGRAYGSNHAWNSIVIDGKKYYFDVTLNDSMKTNKWSFISEKTLRQTHSW